ncbi:hypothetical protein [Paenibacillus harenae]|uniref:hypothetical protein n=1 Tax=Paenibacillus harenae TaxID=306543 RepID=UPI0004186F10|nr:hypothetical protein [Paenibacillus harenae]
MKRNAAGLEQRLDIEQLPMDRSRARSDDLGNVGCGYFLLLLEQKLNDTALPGRCFDKRSSSLTRNELNADRALSALSGHR